MRRFSRRRRETDSCRRRFVWIRHKKEASVRRRPRQFGWHWQALRLASGLRAGLASARITLVRSGFPRSEKMEAPVPLNRSCRFSPEESLFRSLPQPLIDFDLQVLWDAVEAQVVNLHW